MSALRTPVLLSHDRGDSIEIDPDQWVRVEPGSRAPWRCLLCEAYTTVFTRWAEPGSRVHVDADTAEWSVETANGKRQSWVASSAKHACHTERPR